MRKLTPNVALAPPRESIEGDEGHLLTYRQAAALINVPIGTLYGWVHDRRIPVVRLGPRLVRFRRDELLEWLDGHRVEAGAGKGGEA